MHFFSHVNSMLLHNTNRHQPVKINTFSNELSILYGLTELTYSRT